MRHPGLHIDETPCVFAAFVDGWAIVPVRSSLRVPQPISRASQGAHAFHTSGLVIHYTTTYSVVNWKSKKKKKKVIFSICLMIFRFYERFFLDQSEGWVWLVGWRCSLICLISKVMSIQKKSSFSLASFLEKLPGDFFSHTEVSHCFF